MTARCLLLLAMAWPAPGCTNVHLLIGEPLDLECCAAFESEQTTRAEVLAAMGPPMALSAHGDGVALMYEYIELNERQLGLGLHQIGDIVGMALGQGKRAPGSDVIKISMGRSGSEREVALFLFGPSGVLESYCISTWSQAMGRGGSAQFIVSVENVVDSDAFLVSPRSLGWGNELLEPLPSLLNQPHRPDLELRADPTHAGQRTLEQREFGSEKR